MVIGNLESVMGSIPPIEDGLKLMIENRSQQAERSVSLQVFISRGTLLKLQRHCVKSVRRRRLKSALSFLQAE